MNAKGGMVKHIFGLLVICTFLAGAALADAINLNFNGSVSSLNGFVDDNVVFVSPKDFLPALGANVLNIEPNAVTVRLCDKIFRLPFVIREAAPYLDGVMTAKTLGYQATQTGLMLNITGTASDCKPDMLCPKT
jgi:hypothetical protein